MRLLAPLAAAIALTGAPAFAQDGPNLAYPTVSTQGAVNWTGFSIGAQVGYLWAETDGPALDGDDTTFGLRAYYDIDNGTGFVFGGGIQYDSADIDLDGLATIDEVLRIGARAGIASGQNWYYGTLGFAQAYTSGPAAAGDSNGVFGGLGYEVMLADGVSAGAEILYHRFEDFDIPTLEAEATTFSLSLNYRF